MLPDSSPPLVGREKLDHHMPLTRYFLAAIVAGLLAGLAFGLLQEWRVVPLILEAEVIEHASSAHTHEAAENWAPSSRLERSFYTILTSMLIGVGYTALLTGTSLLAGPAITKNNSLIWGLCGFLAFSLAPAVGLPPELPGMPSAPLQGRQVWWVATVLLTAIGLWLIATKPKTFAPMAGGLILLTPHLIGAPTVQNSTSSIPPHLASTFMANSLATQLLFWVLIGYLTGVATHYFIGDERDHG